MSFVVLSLLFLLLFERKEGSLLSKLESKFQKDFIDEAKERYPGCIALKNDSSYIQGFPDWTILYNDKWVVLEAKRNKNAKISEIENNMSNFLKTKYFSFFDLGASALHSFEGSIRKK